TGCLIEHFGNADAVPQLPERCLSRKAGIVRCCPKSIHFDNSGGFLCESRRWPFIGIFRYGFGKCSAV
ncbi:MAG: hypothetical protein U0M83_05935, partial [Faecalibacterium prausnitzii]